MIKNFFKTAWRNLIKAKGYSAINITGLAVGMMVAMMIGLWIYDELSFDKYHKNYERIVRVMQNQSFNGEIGTQFSNPAVLSTEIRKRYGSDFKYVIQSSWNSQHTLTYGQKKLLKSGSYFEPGITEMLSLNIIKGKDNNQQEPYSIMLSESVAKAYFGNENPINKTLRIDNQQDLKVTAVYEDLPYNTYFKDVTYMLPWKLYLIMNPWIEKMESPWGSNFTQTFALMADNVDIQKASQKIRNVKLDATAEEDRKYKPTMFLEPMKNWHLRADFKNGVNVGGRIQYVWLFGIVGLFVLLLACINFMNLSTARSEKRAKEVGVRKAIGSERKQLIFQFFSESFIVVILSFLVALLLLTLLLPFFNDVADKKIQVPWSSPLFWLAGLAFCVFTGLVAGSYPALYLSSFQPVKVLKGTFRVGRFAAIPRKVLVVMQFAVSVMLIIGTIIVYRQISHARNRPIGYDRQSLVSSGITEALHKNIDALRNELKTSGVIVEMAESGSPVTAVWNSNGGFKWEGKDPNLAVDFPNNPVSPEYGKVIGWQIIEGRDFSREYGTDTAAFILNESAVKFIGLKNPVGKTIFWEDKPYTVIGVSKDMLAESPYMPVRAAMYHCRYDAQNITLLKINSHLAPNVAMKKIETAYRKYDPATAYEFQFVDEEFNKKFGYEERIGRLASIFAVLAVLISCLGLFGLASFVAEQRTKEIGIRKVVGASIFNVWKLLSTDFILLVIIASVIAAPLAWYGMHNWLQQYDYKVEISWWVFAIAIAGALIITLFTVSFQAIKAALANPVKSLRTE